MKKLNDDTKQISIREYIYRKNKFLGFLFVIIFLIPVVPYIFINNIIPEFWVFTGFLHQYGCFALSILFSLSLMDDLKIVVDKEENDYHFKPTCYHCEKEYELFMKSKLIRERKEKIIRLNEESNKESN